MSLQCHFKYNSELHHLRMGKYKKPDDVKHVCLIEFVLYSILSINPYIDLLSSSSDDNIPQDTNIFSTVWFRYREEPT